MAKNEPDQETIEERVTTLEARRKREAIDLGSTICGLSRLHGTMQELQRNLSGVKPTDKDGKVVNPGDEITWVPMHHDSTKPPPKPQAGYFGGFRPNGALILFLRDDAGQLARHYYPRPNWHSQITNRQKDNAHGKEEEGR